MSRFKTPCTHFLGKFCIGRTDLYFVPLHLVIQHKPQAQKKTFSNSESFLVNVRL